MRAEKTVCSACGLYVSAFGIVDNDGELSQSGERARQVSTSRAVEVRSEKGKGARWLTPCSAGATRGGRQRGGCCQHTPRTEEG